MATLSVGQLFANDAPQTYSDTVADDTWAAVWTPASGSTLRIRQVEISGEFAVGDEIFIGDDETEKLRYRWENGIIVITIPGEGWPLSAADNPLKVKHQNGGNVDVSVNVWGREE